MKSKATLKELAKELGVSTSTVSKALSDSPEISEVTKRKIKEFAQLRNYKPNSVAKNLKNKRTHTIGVILPNILNPFFAKVFSGIEKYANKRGYNLITCTSNESLTKEKQMLEMLDNGAIDGFVLALAKETQKENNLEHLKQVIKGGTPIVLFDRIANELKCDKVIVDDYESGFHATQYLIDTGCKRIAIVSTIENSSVGDLRAKGYFEALAKNQRDSDSDLILLAQEEKEFDSKIEALLDEKPDGIFALNEHVSVATMKLALKKGFRIPDDLSIIGFADGLWSRRMTPSLSTVSQHAPEIGQKAAELLIERIEQEIDSEELIVYKTEIIKTELRKRDSVRKL
ncbi:LacI family DNA-binding transcriptional regulator [Flavobacterium sp.]|jgi:LacI family transcriptional regulator|uniref:LacI family DNA-binding transcriptional regulator n=1 Tax=Flavobacterium sp. TaxID=239 RepID=UPI0025C34F06|nr:LacI family DNA-binding transcriptional regulator [Flavobacterium sp.]